MPDSSTGIWLGIDLGTTHSSTAVWDATRSRPKWLRSSLAFAERGKLGRVVPSAVLVMDESISINGAMDVGRFIAGHSLSAIVGAEALRLLDHAYDGQGRYAAKAVSAALVTSVKTRLSEEQASVEVTPLGWNQSIQVKVDTILAILLAALKESSEDYLRRTTTRKHLVVPGANADYRSTACVIGVPARFTHRQRQVIMEAARHAGFTGHVTTLTESSAAALAYGLNVSVAEHKRVLVFDMGGGTTDVTVAELSTKGDLSVAMTKGLRLGGDDIDEKLADMLMERWNLKSLPPHEHRRLRRQTQEAKERLCGNIDADVAPQESVSIIWQGQAVQLGQADLAKALQPSLDKLRTLLQSTLDDYHHMNEVILVGGSSRIPAVRDLLRHLFPPPPYLCLSVGALSAVAQGTAIQAALLSGHVPEHAIKSAMMLDGLPYPIGAMVGDRFVEILPKDAVLPATGYAEFALADPRQPGVTVEAVEHVGDGQYEPIGSFTLLLHRLTDDQWRALGNEPRTVDIGMVMKRTGEFVVSVFDRHDPEHVRKRHRYETQGQVVEGVIGDRLVLEYLEEDAGLTREQLLLSVLMLVLVAFYLAARAMFHKVPLVDDEDSNAAAMDLQ